MRPTVLGWVRQLIRRAGLDANPLRRASDRAEAWIRLVLFLVFLAGVPVSASGGGHWVRDQAISTARAEAVGEHRTRAVLVRDAPLFGGYPMHRFSRFAWVWARWIAPGGSTRTGMVAAPAGTQAGRTVPIWINSAGQAVGSPMGHAQILSRVIAAGMLGTVLLALVLLGVRRLSRRALDRRRLAQWEAAWSAVEPQWTKRPH